MFIELLNKKTLLDLLPNKIYKTLHTLSIYLIDLTVSRKVGAEIAVWFLDKQAYSDKKNHVFKKIHVINT